MLICAHWLSSSPDLFSAECDNLKEIFLKLKYPERLINSTINRFIESHDQEQALYIQVNKPIGIILPFKHQRSANEDSSLILLRKLTATCSQCLQARKLLMRSKWQNPNHLHNALFMNTKCHLCDAGYVGYTCGHLFQRINEHKHSVIGKHLRDIHNLRKKDLHSIYNPQEMPSEAESFNILLYMNTQSP